MRPVLSGGAGEAVTPSDEHERCELESALDECCAELANDELGVVLIVAQRLARIGSHRADERATVART